MYLNYVPNTLDITLVRGGTLPNETHSKEYPNLNLYGPNWILDGTATVAIKDVGGKSQICQTYLLCISTSKQ